MNDHIVRSTSGTGRVPLVNLIVSFDGQGSYLVQTGLAGPKCPRVALPAETGGSTRLGPRIEAAARISLGLVVTYVELLSFEVSSDGADIYALVTSHQPVSWPRDTTVMTLPQLIDAGAEIPLIQLFQAAAHRTSAEEFAVTIGGSVQRALARSVEYLEERFSIEDGRAGWSQYLSGDAVGVLSSAQGLLALAHANVRSRYIEPAASCLAEAQNEDGGWQVKHSLIGVPNEISITESTCYCLWALIEAGRPADAVVISSGAAWLLATQRGSGGWGVSEHSTEAQVIATSFAVRILATLGYPQAVAKGLNWLRYAQGPDGGWAFRRVIGPESRHLSTPASTSHAVITLLAAGVPVADPAVAGGCAYLRSRFKVDEVEPWPSTISDTLIDPRTDSRLSFRHYTTPWALVALSLAGADLSDPVLQHGISSLLALQMESGAWRCSLTYPGMQTVWAAHDAVFALKSVVSIGVVNLAPMAMRGHSDRSIAVLESMIVHLLAGGTIAPGAGAALGT